MGLANIAVTVQFGSAPQGACTPSSLNALIGQLNTLVSVTNSTTGNISYFNYGDTTPSPENRIYPWLTITNAQWYNYVGGAWVPVNPSHIWYAGGTTGAADAYVASTVATYPSATTLTVGDVFLITINVENTGSSTLAMNGLAAAALTAGIDPLTAGQLEANSTYLVCWDGTRFRVLNPTVVAPPGVTVAQFVYQEPSLTAPVAIGAGNTTIPFATIIQSQSWASLGGGGAVTIQEGTYLITGTLSIADVGGTAGGSGQLALRDGSTDLNWQDFNINNVDDTVVVTVMAVITVAPSGTASITAQIFLSAGGSGQYGVDSTSARNERPASLTIMRLPQ